MSLSVRWPDFPAADETAVAVPRLAAGGTNGIFASAGLYQPGTGRVLFLPFPLSFPAQAMTASG